MTTGVNLRAVTTILLKTNTLLGANHWHDKNKLLTLSTVNNVFSVQTTPLITVVFVHVGCCSKGDQSFPK